MFVLPDELPATVAELDDLRDQAQRSINVIQARAAAPNEVLTDEDLSNLERLLEAVDTIDAARAEAADAEANHAARVTELLERANRTTATADTAPEGEGEDDAEDGDDDDADSEDEETETEQAIAASGGRPSFAGVGADAPPERTREAGWEMDPSCPGYRTGMGRVGFAELAAGIDSVRPGSRTKNRPNKAGAGSFHAQVLARLPRDVQEVEDSHALVAAINAATNQAALPGGSLVAAGGWCAPSEQLYDFCDVPDATDLISLPEITVNRGGIRWPVEPDMSAILPAFQFFFTETQLEAVDGGTGLPTAVKNCVEIPCVDEFEEIRLNAVGYCVEAGILQTQGWPELIEWFMRTLAAEHLRAISRRTVTDMVNGSGAAKVIPNTSTIGVVPSVLNSIALQAWNLRSQRGLSRNATIEGVAPSWLLEIMRADLAMNEGMDVKAVTDAQILNWFAVRNIAFQFVGDWQTRAAGKPGDLGTLTWPTTVDVLLYPAGTWFRSMSPVIELGVMYPKEQLQVNRYTRFFTEDAIAVGKRCNQSILVTVPLELNGAIGPRVLPNAG